MKPIFQSASARRIRQAYLIEIDIHVHQRPGSGKQTLEPHRTPLPNHSMACIADEVRL